MFAPLIRSDFPSLANNPSSQNVKGIPVKGGAQSEGSSKKASKPVEHSVTASPAITRSLSKGKKDTESKFSGKACFSAEESSSSCFRREFIVFDLLQRQWISETGARGSG